MVSVDLKALVGRLNRFSTRALEAAAGLCVSRTNYEVTVEHVLYQMLEDPGCDIDRILRHFEIDRSRARKAFLRAVEDFKTGNAGRPVFSPLLMEWVQDAWVMASIDHGLAEVRSGILLRAFLANTARLASEDYSELFRGVRREELRDRYDEIVAESLEGEAKVAERRAGGAAAGAGPGAAPPTDGTALSKYTINFTERAGKGEIDPVFGRDREIRQMIDILARRRKNNPICVGEAGVGKTAVVEGLALRVVEGDVPDVLKGVDILCLDLGLLQAGAGVRGEFENRLKSVIQEVKSSPKPIIIFIDEAHTLIGAGGPSGGGDAANLLKPALARGELRTVAATTWSEYKKYFEKDAALARRFQLVKLDEPDDETVTTMLRGLRDRYEASHAVSIRDGALEAAARLASRYISGRQHPDKGVDLVDTACARIKIGLSSKPDVLQDLERRIQTLEREAHAHRRDLSTGEAAEDPRIAELEEEIRKVKEEAASVTERWQKEKAAAEKVLRIRAEIERLEEGAAGVAASAEGGAAGSAAAKAATAPGRPAGPAAGDAAGPGVGSGGNGSPAGDAAGSGVGSGRTGSPADVAALRDDLRRAMAELAEIQGKDPLLHVEVGPETIARVVSDWTGIPVGKMVRDEAKTLLAFEENLQRRIKGQDHVLGIVGNGIRAAKAGLKSPNQPMGVFLFVGPSGVGKTECALGVADILFGGERFLTTINMSEFQEKHTVSRLIGSPPGYVGYGEGGVLTEAVRQHPYAVVLLDEVEKADPEVMNLFYQVFDKGTLSDGEGREIGFKDTVIFMTSNLASDTIISASEDPDCKAEDLVAAIRPALSRHFKPALLARMTIVPFYPIRPEIMKEIASLKLGQLASRLEASHRIALRCDPAVIDAIAGRCTEVETGARNVDHILSGTLLPQISMQLLRQMSEGPLPPSLTVGISGSGEFTYAFG